VKCEVIGVYLVNLWCIGNDSIKVFGNYVKCIFFLWNIKFTRCCIFNFYYWLHL